MYDVVVVLGWLLLWIFWDWVGSVAVYWEKLHCMGRSGFETLQDRDELRLC
jgi:hypothetical protein